MTVNTRSGRYMVYARTMVAPDFRMYSGMPRISRDGRVLGFTLMGTNSTAVPWLPAWIKVSRV